MSKHWLDRREQPPMQRPPRFKPLPVFIAIFLILCGTGRINAQMEGSAPFSSAGTTAEAVTDFLRRLQKAVHADERKTVAGLMSYPLRAWDGKRTVNVKDQRQFLASYNTIVTADLKKTIADAAVEKTFANWQGVMIDSGRIWFRPNEPEPCASSHQWTVRMPQPTDSSTGAGSVGGSESTRGVGEACSIRADP